MKEMILTEICRETFRLWLYFNYYNKGYQSVYSDFEQLPKTIQNALIIAFFDSEGFSFWITPYYNHDLGVMKEWAGYDKNGLLSGTFKTRDEATNNSIYEINKRYNERAGY